MAARGSNVGTLLRERGFTLVELMVTLVILAVVMITLMGVMFGASRSRTATTNQLESVQAVRAGLDLMTRDLRSAGYGADLDYAAQPQPAIAYVDSTQVLINANLQPYPDNVPAHTPPLAYDPAGSPRPRPLDGTSWAPPIKYHSGAELIRWTLDVNNDGKVDADDLAAPDGADAQRTPNPEDFVLVRQVYGDSIGYVAGANGGVSERVALVDGPGVGVPPIFTVHFKGVAAPWDWKNGPVPASMLAQISSLTVRLTASSAHRNADGTYARTTLRTEVSSNRNVPDTGAPLFAIDGYVYDDKNRNHAKDAGEPGIPGAYLLLGTTMSATTDATGHYAFHVESGTYRLKHIAPNGYGVFTSPDSMIFSVGPDQTCSFADTAKSGGFIHVITYRDSDGDGWRDPGEPAEPGVKITATPGPDVQYTEGSGKATLFVPTGAFTVTMTPPDSLFASTPNPVYGTMIKGDTAGVVFGLRATAFGTISGKVFRDVNRNGNWDSGEDGIAGVWVQVSSDRGATLIASAATDANGDYSIQVPVNDPPRTTPYAVYVTPPQGYFATGPTALSPVWVKENTDAGGRNFGALAFQLITLQAARVLSLANGDLVEHDWPLSQTSSRVRDLDLVLGSDANGSDQISVWFNRYDSSTLFSSAADYKLSVAASVLALAVDTLDTGSNLQRERADVVTGTNFNSKNNFYVWLNQNSSGNEGFLPTTPTRSYASKDKGDVTALLTADLCGATSAPDGVDILVGTNSKANGQGSIELWQNDNAKTPGWNRVGLYPPDGSIANSSVGEVTAMALADLDGDGLRDLVVTTLTSVGAYTGQILFLKNQGRTSNPVFLYMSGQSLAEDVPTSVGVTDVDGDGSLDVVVGTQSGAATGSVQYWRNTTPSIFDFTRTAKVSAPGIVYSVVAADLGGDSRKDVAAGYRTSTSGYGGGVRIFYSDLGTLVGPGVDPTGGAVVNFVPTMTTGNFNYGMYPASPYPPFLDDLAVGVKVSDTTGALVLLIR